MSNSLPVKTTSLTDDIKAKVSQTDPMLALLKRCRDEEADHYTQLFQSTDPIKHAIGYNELRGHLAQVVSDDPTIPTREGSTNKGFWYSYTPRTVLRAIKNPNIPGDPLSLQSEITLKLKRRETLYLVDDDIPTLKLRGKSAAHVQSLLKNICNIELRGFNLSRRYWDMRVGATSRELHENTWVLVGSPVVSKAIKIKIDPNIDTISLVLQHGHSIHWNYPWLSELPETKQKNVAVLLFNRVKQMVYRDKVLQE